MPSHRRRQGRVLVSSVTCALSAPTRFSGRAPQGGPRLPRAAARDLDIVRAVLGDGRLTYLGVSYGTELGATYAEVFPQRVGRMVLDAGLDPTMDDTVRMLGLAAGFESALNRYVAYCLNSAGCPLPQPPAAAVDRVRALIADLAGHPLPTGTARDLTPALAVAAIMQGVAADQAWFDLSIALGSA